MKRRAKLTKEEIVTILSGRLRNLLAGKGSHPPMQLRHAIEACASTLHDLRFDTDPIFREFQ